jgi:hypothetical protein
MILQFPGRTDKRDSIETAAAAPSPEADADADPIFAALARYRAATDAFNAFDGPDDDRQNVALEAAYYAARDPAFETVPTTLAGMKAKISFFMNDKHMSEGLTGTETNEPLHDFLDTLYKSACIIAGVGAATA